MKSILNQIPAAIFFLSVISTTSLASGSEACILFVESRGVNAAAFNSLNLRDLSALGWSVKSWDESIEKPSQELAKKRCSQIENTINALVENDQGEYDLGASPNAKKIESLEGELEACRSSARADHARRFAKENSGKQLFAFGYEEPAGENKKGLAFAKIVRTDTMGNAKPFATLKMVPAENSALLKKYMSLAQVTKFRTSYEEEGILSFAAALQRDALLYLLIQTKRFPACPR